MELFALTLINTGFAIMGYGIGYWRGRIEEAKMTSNILFGMVEEYSESMTKFKDISESAITELQALEFDNLAEADRESAIQSISDTMIELGEYRGAQKVLRTLVKRMIKSAEKATLFN